MADDNTAPAVDPNTGQPSGWMSDLTQAFSNPLVQGLMGLSAGFGQAAMPTRMRIPFGAALGMGMGGFSQGIGNAYKMQLEQQQAQQAQLNNQLAQAQMPAKIAQANIQRAALAPFLQNPDLLRQLTTPGGWGTGTPNMAPQLPGQQQGPPPTAGTYEGTIAAQEGTSQNPKSSAAGVGQFTVPTWLNFAAANPELFKGMSQQQILAARSNPAIGSQAITWLAQQNAPVLAQNGVTPSGQSLRLAHYIGAGPAAAVMQAPDNAPVSNFVSPDAVKANAELGTLTAGQLRGRYVNVPDPSFLPQARPYQVAQAGGPPVAPSGGPPAAPPQGGPVGVPGIPTPAQALQQAAELNRRAQIGDITGTPLFGDPAMLRQQAQILMKYGLAPTQANLEELGRQQAQLQYAAPIASAKAQAEKQVGLAYDPVIEAEKARLSGQYKPETMRPGTVNRMNVGGQMQWVGTPAAESIAAPDGTNQHVWVTPPTPDHLTPIVTPMLNPQTGQPLVEKIAPQLQEQRNEAAKEFATKGSESFVAAQNTQAWLNQIDNAANTMNKPGGPGYLNTGPYAQVRYSIISQINDALRTAGASPGTLIDEKAIGSWEELKKATTTAGFELSSHYEGHARQAATTIQNATAAVPGEANSPQGMVNVSAGVREGSNTSIDAYNYAAMVNRLTNGAGLVDAPVDFYKAVPATMYANRAISINHPVTISDPKDLTKYLPGTFFVTPSKPGEVRQVPDRTIEIGTVQTERGPVAISMPFTAPAYLQNLQRFAAQAGAQTSGR